MTTIIVTSHGTACPVAPVPDTPSARATLYAIIKAALAAQVEKRKRHE